VTDHELDAVVDDFVRDRYRLFWITGVIVFNGFEFLAVYAAARTIAANSLEICLVALVIVLHSYCCSFYSPGAVAAEPGQISSISSGKCPRQLYRYSVERQLLAWEAGARGQNLRVSLF
jgi:hypothetical protein